MIHGQAGGRRDQREMQGQAGAHVGFGAQGAAHGAGQALGQGHADAQGQLVAILDAARAQRVVNPGQALLRRAGGVVAHAAFQAQAAPLVEIDRAGLEAGLDHAATAGQGVFDQGVEHLQHAARVDQGGGLGIAVIGKHQGRAALGGAGAPAGLDGVAEVAQQGRGQGQGQVAGRRAAQVHGAAQNLAHVAAGVADGADEGAGVGRQTRLLQPLGEGQNAVQVAADVVGHALDQGHGLVGLVLAAAMGGEQRAQTADPDIVAGRVDGDIGAAENGDGALGDAFDEGRRRQAGLDGARLAVHHLGGRAGGQVGDGPLAQEHVAIDHARGLAAHDNGHGAGVGLREKDRPNLRARCGGIDRGSAVDKAVERVHAAVRRGVVGMTTFAAWRCGVVNGLAYVASTANKEGGGSLRRPLRPMVVEV